MANETGATLPPASCIVIATDGSCKPNPGPGGYAAILLRYVDGIVKNRLDLKGGAAATTNNRMELQAAISALKRIKRDEPLPILVRSDSKYLVDGWNVWLTGWVAKGWKKGDGKPVENADLWREVMRLCDGIDVHFHWVRGHSGDLMNEAADRLAAKACAVWTTKAAKAMFGQAA